MAIFGCSTVGAAMLKVAELLSLFVSLMALSGSTFTTAVLAVVTGGFSSKSATALPPAGNVMLKAWVSVPGPTPLTATTTAPA